MTRIERALQAAENAVSVPPNPGPRHRLDRPRRVAIGDPQAPLERFFAILVGHGLLGRDGRLREDVALVSAGDHFDWGGRERRAEAARGGLRLLAWLAAHPPDQVALLLGNHDMARVAELAGFDDPGFAEAQAEADRAYHDGVTEEAAEERLLARFPCLASAETAARDLASFRVEQRTLVASLLRARRFCLAYAAADDLLLSHAGVTRDELAGLGIEATRSNAAAIADALNAALDAAVASWDGETPLAIPSLYQPGSAQTGEARGMLLHRPAHDQAWSSRAPASAPRRRYDPRRLPAGLTQAIGHIRDKKCRTLLGSWSDSAAAHDGPLRHLHVDGPQVRYARGLPARGDPRLATLVFVDGGMNFVRDVADYELLDLATRGVAPRAGS